MKISFDAQLLFEKQKTGIGWTADYVLRNIIREFKNEYCLNYFSMRKGKEKEDIIIDYKDLGYKINKCSWYHNVIYKRTWNAIPLPYSILFGKEAQITQFFNYDVPPGVKGKAVTFIYDMVYKAFPETVNDKTKKMLDYNLSVACKRADHIITISEFSKNEIMKYMNIAAEKISIMPCGVDTTIYHPNYTEEDILRVRHKYGITEEYILYLGTLEPRKNLERLIEAYELLHRHMNNVPKLVLAGKKGWMFDKIYNLIELYNLTEKVIFTGYIDADEAPILIKGGLLFVFPSIYEGFGIPPLEAMACGTPVLVSNQASLPEVVGDAGYLINPYDIIDMSNAMQMLIENNNMRKDMSAKGLQKAQTLSWKNSVNKLMSIYKSILKEK